MYCVHCSPATAHTTAEWVANGMYRGAVTFRTTAQMHAQLKCVDICYALRRGSQDNVVNHKVRCVCEPDLGISHSTIICYNAKQEHYGVHVVDGRRAEWVSLFIVS